MKNLLTISVAFVLTSSIANAAIQVEFYRVYAPNAYGSSSYGDFWSNTQYAILNGLSNYGSGISEFKEVAEVTGVESYVTSYNSWKGAEVAGEYGARPSWAYRIYDDTGADVSIAANITREYFDDWGGTRTGTGGWGALPTEYDADRFVGVDVNGVITIDPLVPVKSFIGLSGLAWWHHESGDNIANNGSPYWNDRFTLLAAAGANVEANQTLWGFELGYGGMTFTAPDIAIVPEPGTLALAGLGLTLASCGARLRRRSLR